MPIFASTINAEVAGPVSWCPNINQLSGSRCGDLPGISNDAESTELARADSSSKEPAPLPDVLLTLPLTPLDWRFNGANKQCSCWSWNSDSDVDLCLFSCHPSCLGTRASSAALLMSSSRVALVVPLALLLPCWTLSSADKIPTSEPHDAAPRDLIELLRERCRSFRCLSKPRARHGLARFFPEIRTGWSLTEHVFEFVVRDDVVLVFHPFDH